MSVNEKMTAIADTFRSYTGNTSKLTLDDMPSEIIEVYIKGEDDGRLQGFESGHEEGLEEGQKAEYDRFWDAFQQNGNRTEYTFGFSGRGWTAENFKPKYDIIPIGSMYMCFRNFVANLDLKALFESLGITFDTSKATDLQYAFYNTGFTRIGTLDFSSVTNASALTQTFFNCPVLETIDKIKLATTSGEFSGTFGNMRSLKNITFDGEINRNGLNLQWSTKLSKASIESIVSALSATTSSLTVTLSKAAKEAAFTAEEWATLIATKSNWTISLV